MNNEQALNEMIERFELSEHLIKTNSGVRMESPMGDMEGYKLYIDHDNDTGVHRWIVPKGMTFPVHSHDNIEIVIVYKGCYEVQLKDKVILLKKGDIIRFNIDEDHFVKALEDTLVITVTIPVSKGFPI